MTWYDKDNYGTTLQAYSLQNILSKYGECEIIAYKSKHPGYGFKDIIDPFLRNILFWKIYERTILKLYKKKYEFLERKRKEKMQSFFHRKLRITNKTFDDNSLQSVNGRYHIVVCGSDQIWNPTRWNKHYFLDFINENTPKISYAPSFGVTSLLNKKIKKEVQVLLNRFDFLSVREITGQKIIEKLIGKKIPICLDPTLLQDLSFWNDLSKESDIDLPNEYVFCYLLGRNKKHLKESQKIANTLNLPLIQQAYNISDYLGKINLIPPSGPEDFLKAIKNSKFVCTDSYHGLIFAIIFKKPFIVFKRFNTRNISSQNSRVETLLNIIGLKERLRLTGNSSKKELEEVSFIKCEKKLEKMKEKSMEYLKSAIEISLKEKDKNESME